MTRYEVAGLPVVVSLGEDVPLAETLAAARDAGLCIRHVDEVLRIIVGRIQAARTEALRAVVGVEAVEVERAVRVAPPPVMGGRPVRRGARPAR